MTEFAFWGVGLKNTAQLTPTAGCIPDGLGDTVASSFERAMKTQRAAGAHITVRFDAMLSPTVPIVARRMADLQAIESGLSAGH